MTNYKSEDHYYLRGRDWTVFTLTTAQVPTKGDLVNIDGWDYHVAGVERYLGSHFQPDTAHKIGIAVEGNIFDYAR